MRIDEILAGSDEPVFSIEFFPPRDSEGVQRLFETVETLKPVTVDDAGLVAQFAYFPQLSEERSIRQLLDDMRKQTYVSIRM